MAVLNDASKAAEDLAAVAAALTRSTVQVKGRKFGVGSGVVWNSSLIITNAHVVNGTTATVEFSDGRIFDATCISRDPLRDLAALKVAATDLPAATIGDSNTLRVGELVLAVGNPLGFVSAVSAGIIHAIALPDPLNQWVQADIRLAPGNSGGPLADAQGRVIGINTAIAGGLTLAVPSNAVQRFLLGQARPNLGVTLQPVLVPLGNRRSWGWLILEVHPGSAAESAGLITGDVLLGTSGQLFPTPRDLLRGLLRAEPGTPLQLDFLRGGRRMTCEVHLWGNGTTGVEAA